jgi:hypothetical protein
MKAACKSVEVLLAFAFTLLTYQPSLGEQIEVSHRQEHVKTGTQLFDPAVAGREMLGSSMHQPPLMLPQ